MREALLLLLITTLGALLVVWDAERTNDAPWLSNGRMGKEK
jgi:hypothetical protein